MGTMIDQTARAFLDGKTTARFGSIHFSGGPDGPFLTVPMRLKHSWGIGCVVVQIREDNGKWVNFSGRFGDDRSIGEIFAFLEEHKVKEGCKVQRVNT